MNIIEDTISRNREFKKQRQSRLDAMKRVNAPKELIEIEEMISKMTVAEYKLYCKEQEELDKKRKAIYYKTHSVDKNIVDEIYKRVDALEYDFWKYEYETHFILAIDPLKFMSDEDYYNDLYEPILIHAYELYHNKFRNEHEAYEKSKNTG